MTLRIINAIDAKTGTNIIIEGMAYTVRKIDISKTGKHGSSKCRIEAVSMINDQKKIIAVPGHERFDVPMVNKNKAQVLSIGDKVSVMDLENFETIELECPEELRSQIAENDNVEYWDINGERIIKRKF
ncbi:MAG: translation initiation factor IF-5A [Nanoarchaeota archaeon]